MEPPAPRPVAPSPGDEPGAPSRSRAWLTVGAFVAAIALIVAAVWIVPNLAGSAAGPAPSGSPAAVVAVASGSAQPSLLTPVPTSEITLPPATAGPPISLSDGHTLAKTGALAVLGSDSSLTVVDASGRTVVLAPGSDATFAFPAWSPDGSKLAAIRTDAMGAAILVFDAKRALNGEPVVPTVIFRNATVGPFYLAWTPDGKSVSFLADEPDVLSLRLAPADGSAPLDGSAPGSKIRSGNPFYFDWIGSDRLLAHVGTGSDAFLGVIGLDGSPVGKPLATPGDFRSAVVNHDETLVSYVRASATGPSAVVVARQDGSNEHTMPVFGTAGMAFDPKGDALASIGPTKTPQQQLAIPIGPLRLMDGRTGKVRELLDGTVVSFWWSPDGRTIAALRVQPSEASPPSTPPTPSAVAASAAAMTPSGSPAPGSAAASASPQLPPPTDAYVVFVDVASGAIESQSIIHPSELFIDQFLTFFDQYATSHQIWAPDSSSLIVPVTDAGAETRLAVMPRTGDQRTLIDGEIAFWTP
jgi:TolB protein